TSPGEPGQLSQPAPAVCRRSESHWSPRFAWRGTQVGQRGQTVNLLAHAFGGSNPPLATIVEPTCDGMDSGHGTTAEPRSGRDGPVAARSRDAGIAQW